VMVLERENYVNKPRTARYRFYEDI